MHSPLSLICKFNALTSYTDKQSVHILIRSLIRPKRDMETNKKTDNTKNQKESSISQRRCEIEGKHFIVTRHFAGDKDLTTLMREIAISRADREMGL